MCERVCASRRACMGVGWGASPVRSITFPLSVLEPGSLLYFSIFLSFFKY